MKSFLNWIESLNQEFLYHATYLPYYNNIMKYGLNGNNKRKNWEDSQNGIVYLANDPHEAESYAETSDMVPENWLNKIIVLKINKSLLDVNKIKIDSNNLSGSTIEYHGTIPPNAISIIRH